MEEEDDQHVRFVLNIPPQVAITFRTEKFIINLLGMGKHFLPWKRTFGTGVTSISPLLEYYCKNELGKTIHI